MVKRKWLEFKLKVGEASIPFHQKILPLVT